MAIPALATADKSFICSYNIGSNIDHRKALGIINEITTFTNEYIDGFCWIPVNAGAVNDHSWYIDVPDKDVVYVKVGVRCSADGYLHAWLLDTQQVSELILWYTNYNTQHYAIDDKTVLHWCIEKMYRVIFGNTTSFVLANIKFQKYVGAGSTRLYLFGSYSNSLTNPLSYTIDHPLYVKKSSITWYPNNSTTVLGDFIYCSGLHTTVQDCDEAEIDSVLYDLNISKAFLYDSGSYTDYTTEFNNNVVNDVVLMPLDEEFGDAFYFGYTYRFYELKLNIGTAGAGIGNLIDWEYWNGSTWVDIPGVGDGTNEFKNSGTNTVNFGWGTTPDPYYDSHILKWKTTTVNGSNLYWVRAKSNHVDGIIDYTTQPILTQGWVRIPDYNLNFSMSSWDKNSGEPSFYKYTYDIPESIDTMSLCHPTDPYQPCYRNWEMCHPGEGFDHVGIGNNSGRNYALCDTIGPVACDWWCGVWIAIKRLQANIEPNRAWITVPAHCSNSGYDNQTDCENAGYTWIPSAYACDPSFTYDSLISYTVDKWIGTSASEINYAKSVAKFNGSLIGDKFLTKSYKIESFDIFDEYFNNDLDELRHISFDITTTGIVTNNIYTLYTKHVGVGLLTTSNDPTLNTYNWIVNWSSAEYFSNWQTPDGLSARTPSVTNTPYVRPITHHDAFNVVTDEPVLGGFLYELGTSDAFLSRDPGTETKIVIPISNQADFNFLINLITSNGFLSRDPGTEVKILYPVSKDANFSFLYELIRPSIADLYHLKTDGDDTKDGRTWPNAWKHWTYAMANTPDERTLLVEEGIYNDGETTPGPTNSIIIFLVKNEVDAASIVEVII